MQSSQDTSAETQLGFLGVLFFFSFCFFFSSLRAKNTPYRLTGSTKFQTPVLSWGIISFENRLDLEKSWDIQCCRRGLLTAKAVSAVSRSTNDAAGTPEESETPNADYHPNAMPL